METSELNDLALSLRTARKDRQPISPPSKKYSTLDVKSAFEVQRINVDEAVKEGDRMVGYKLGNIAKVMQESFGVDEPDYGFLLASYFYYEGTKIPLKNFIKPYVELEVSFVLKKALRGPNITVADVMDAIDYAIPTIEIIDSRVKNWEIGLEDTLADNGSTGAVILGGIPRRLTDLTLNDMRGTLYFDGREIKSGNTNYVLGNPLNAVAWLINRLAEFDVEFLPGQFIMPGSCLQAMPMEEAGRWTCVFDGWGKIEFDVV